MKFIFFNIFIIQKSTFSILFIHFREIYFVQYFYHVKKHVLNLLIFFQAHYIIYSCKIYLLQYFYRVKRDVYNFLFFSLRIPAKFISFSIFIMYGRTFLIFLFMPSSIMKIQFQHICKFTKCKMVYFLFEDSYSLLCSKREEKKIYMQV